MDTKKFRIWLIENDYTQAMIAESFGLTENTISNYCKNNRFPRWFKFALRGLENEP